MLKLIAARISSAFEKLPFSPSKVSLQPAPHTLKGAETNVYAEAGKQDFNIALLGQSVHLTATPVEYTYNYGDGSTLGPTPVSGGPLPEDEWGTKTRTSHVYTATGNYPVSVTTSFTGTYSVNGGPPLPITGRGSATSAPQTIQVWRSITKNYADNCIQNPHGEGC
ncbi:PKD domain-containing protein [Pseudarthrobacter sp. J1738]|uniref:PKD domain-containing protein n=1 Tax=Pseudarthrobacter sp. J1738 TaxID=3420446 RepID=UPI003D2E0D99